MSPAWARCVDDATVELLRATSWSSPRDELRDCAHCRWPFWAHLFNARYCSASCAAKASYRRRRRGVMAYQAAYRAARRITLAGRRCANDRCGEVFVPTPSTRRYCSAACSDRVRNRRAYHRHRTQEGAA